MYGERDWVQCTECEHGGLASAVASAASGKVGLWLLGWGSCCFAAASGVWPAVGDGHAIDAQQMCWEVLARAVGRHLGIAHISGDRQ
jgi:hypothetical protein